MKVKTSELLDRLIRFDTSRDFTLPENHKPGMRVPKGGSSCAKCKYLKDDKKTCGNKYFVRWHGSAVIPAPIDEYCSDWFET